MKFRYIFALAALFAAQHAFPQQPITVDELSRMASEQGVVTRRVSRTDSVVMNYPDTRNISIYYLTDRPTPLFAMFEGAEIVRPEKEFRPLFGVKTNLLFDAATAVNVEVEIPIGQRWSLAGEWMFPWWLIEHKQYALETGTAFLEGRYWFGDRDDRKQMTGWFAGLNAGWGYYDLGTGLDKGFQGELLTVGVSGGFAHAINKKGTLRMEYSLSAGYMATKYREYSPVLDAGGEWHLMYKKSGRFNWAGPTRAKVSLVWMLGK